MCPAPYHASNKGNTTWNKSRYPGMKEVYPGQHYWCSENLTRSATYTAFFLPTLFTNVESKWTCLGLFGYIHTHTHTHTHNVMKMALWRVYLS